MAGPNIVSNRQPQRVRCVSGFASLPAGSPPYPRRIEFVILRTASSPPAALHPASRRRSCLQLRGHGLPRHGLSPCYVCAFTSALGASPSARAEPNAGTRFASARGRASHAPPTRRVLRHSAIAQGGSCAEPCHQRAQRPEAWKTQSWEQVSKGVRLAGQFKDGFKEAAADENGARIN